MERLVLGMISGAITALPIGIIAILVMNHMGFDLLESRTLWIYFGVTIPLAGLLAIFVVSPALYRAAGV